MSGCKCFISHHNGRLLVSCWNVPETFPGSRAKKEWSWSRKHAFQTPLSAQRGAKSPTQARRYPIRGALRLDIGS
jgi:hypothetical protein